MLQSFFHALTVATVVASRLVAATSEGVVDYNALCDLVSGNKSIVGFSFGGGSNLVADGSIVTGTLSLSEEHYEYPPASVAISAPGLKCGRTTFTFDANDPSTFDQSVTCRTDGGSVPAGKDGALVDVAMIFDYTTLSTDAALQIMVQKSCEKILLQRQLADSGRGGGVGDPHLTTFDRVNYDFQKPGVFRLFQSRNLLVQTFQEKCAPTAFRGEASPSCYQGVAVSFAGSVVKLFIQNGKIQLGKGTSCLDWLSVEKNKGRTDSYRVFITVDQSYVDVTLNTWTNRYPYLNIAVMASPYFRDQSVQGLLGNWNGNPSDDIRDNNKLAELHAFPLTDNLFTCVGDDCAKFLQTSTLKDDMAKSLRNDMKMLHQNFDVVPPATIVLRSFTPVLVPFVKKRGLRGMETDGSSAGQIQVHAPGDRNETITFPPTSVPHADVTLRAVELCNYVIRQSPTSICDRYIGNRDFYIDAVCVGDAVLLGDLTIVDNTKLNYLRECRRELDSLIEANTTTTAAMKTLVNDRLSLMFGDLTKCASNCSGHGTCLAAGCKCDLGFTGAACETRV